MPKRGRLYRQNVEKTHDELEKKKKKKIVEEKEN
jgi:hypothetical protein